MKKIIASLALIAQASLLLAKDNDTPFMTKTFSNETVNAVEVETAGGSIAVTGNTSGPSRIEVFVNGNNGNRTLSNDEIQKILDEKYELKIGVSGNKLSAIARNKTRNDWKNSLSISFRIYVPVNVSTDLGTSGGSISLKDVNGNLSFTTSGGSLNVDHVGGKVRGTTSGGSIHVTDSKDDIELTTSGGSIEASNCNGNLKLTTSGGSLHLNQLQGDIRATTSGGSVKGSNISGTLVAFTSGGSIRLDALACNLETSTSGGNIDVAVVQPGKYIKIGNSAGNVHLQVPKSAGYDLDMTANKVSAPSLNNFSGKVENEKVNGQLNGGGTRVSVKAGSGKIYFDVK